MLDLIGRVSYPFVMVEMTLVLIVIYRKPIHTPESPSRIVWWMQALKKPVVWLVMPCQVFQDLAWMFGGEVVLGFFSLAIDILWWIAFSRIDDDDFWGKRRRAVKWAKAKIKALTPAISPMPVPV